MKKNYLFKNIGRIAVAIGLLATTLLSSCKKDTSPGALNLGTSPALVTWQYAGFNAVPYTAILLPQAGQTLALKVTLSVASITQSTPVTVTAVESSTALAAYEAANLDTLTELPTTQYTIPNSGKITIAPGQQYASFVITFAANSINFAAKPALAFNLTDASGAQLTSNLNTAIVLIKVKSPYEGNYAVTSGATTRYNGGTVASGLRDQFAVTETSLYFLTYNASTVIGQAGSSAFGLSVAITISGTTVTVGPDPTGGATESYINGDSSGQSSYNPSTKTLTLHYSYLNGSGDLREIDEVLVGPS